MSQFGEIPNSNRPDLAHDGVSPRELAHSSDAINQRFNYSSAQDFTAQQPSQPASGFSQFGQGGGGQQGNGGPTNVFVSSSSQALAVGGGSSSGGSQEVIVAEVTSPSPPVDSTPDADDLAGLGEYKNV